MGSWRQSGQMSVDWGMDGQVRVGSVWVPQAPTFSLLILQENHECKQEMSFVQCASEKRTSSNHTAWNSTVRGWSVYWMSALTEWWFPLYVKEGLLLSVVLPCCAQGAGRSPEAQWLSTVFTTLGHGLLDTLSGVLLRSVSIRQSLVRSITYHLLL